jgi:protein-S-isoprenylcysteine O-methyltransferase Ste14
MGVVDHLERSGRLLFRWRGYLPVLVLAMGLVVESASPLHAAHAVQARWWDLACLLVSAAGLALRVAAVGCAPEGTSGRNAREQRAFSLNSTGLYSVVRHPLYLGNFFMMLGVVLFARSPWLAGCFVLAFWLYYERIMAAEEAFLRERFGADFDAWSQATPAFLPRLSGWRPSALPFSLRNALRREYNGFFAVVLSMFLLDLARNRAEDGSLAADPRWRVMLAIGALVWLVLRLLKRHTDVLRVRGR